MAIAFLGCQTTVDANPSQGKIMWTILTRGDFTTQWHFWRPDPAIEPEAKWAEVRDALNILQGPGQLSTINNYLVQNVRGTEAEEACLLPILKFSPSSPLGLRSIERIGPLILCQEISPQETQCSQEGNVYFQLWHFYTNDINSSKRS